MGIRLHLLFSFFLVAGTIQSQKSFRDVSSHQQAGLILDMEEVFAAEEEQALSKSLEEFEQQTKSKLFIISVGDMEDFSDFDQYALHLLDQYDFQKKVNHNGLAIVFSGGLRKIHLNTELERRKIVEDSVYERVVRELLIPSFKEGEYDQGIEKIISELLRVYNR